MIFAYAPLLPAAAELQATPATTGYIKYWDGSQWVKKPVKYWDGSQWVLKPIKWYDGSQWLVTN
jgi:hypothetical protein